MCGRFEIHSTLEIIAKIFKIDPGTFDIKPNYNIAPSQDVAVVMNDGKKNCLASCHWGFVPAWCKELKTGYRMINARAETVATNRTFRDAFQNTRCIVPVDGFYHWKKEGKTRTPYYVRLKNGNPMGLAGLYNNWRSPEGEEVCTFTIVTTDSNDLLSSIHPRMPVIIPGDGYRLWLDPAVHDRETLRALLKPYPSDEMEHYPVTPKVNSFKYNDPENIKPLAA